MDINVYVTGIDAGAENFEGIIGGEFHLCRGADSHLPPFVVRLDLRCEPDGSHPSPAGDGETNRPARQLRGCLSLRPKY